MTVETTTAPIVGALPPPEARPCWVAGVPGGIYHSDQGSVSSSALRTAVLRTPAHARAAQKKAHGISTHGPSVSRLYSRQASMEK
jgi:hypothetical protein